LCLVTGTFTLLLRNTFFRGPARLIPMRLLLLPWLGVVLSLSAFAQFGFPTQVQHGVQDADIRNRVAQYCRLDYLGARLTEQDWPKLQPVVNWPSNPEFPMIDVISRYEVDSNVTSASHGKWNVTVHYHLLGRFNMGQGYTTEVAGSVKNADFTVADSNGELKVTDADPNYPHPSRAAMLKWLEDQQAAADPGTKIIYEHAIKELSAQSGSPFGK